MTENCYFKVTLKMEYEDAKGNMKKKSEPYIVEAIGPSDVETKIAQYMKGSVSDYEITSVVQTKIVAIIK
ncbi:MAG: DUF4494 family protein [Candidatus Nanoarchaeia archaeon]|jgi:hypothetical protein|nr:DUF4494 family protein [Candidatus Nanoarchaeia archaeon]